MAHGVGFMFVPAGARPTYAVVGGLLIAGCWVARRSFVKEVQATVAGGSGEGAQDRLA